jgi:lipopolysaccharide/colanic/teichoic acid biosynthesis glycosyltransferase
MVNLMDKKLSVCYVGGASETIEALSSFQGFSLEHLPHTLAAINFMNLGKKSDAFLCEMNIAGGSAFEIFEMVKGIPAYSNIPFIIIAFEFSEDTFKKAFQTGIDDFYVLPLPNVQALANRLEFLLEFKKRAGKPTNSTAEKEIKYKMPLSKRLFDVLVASAALICLSPILLLVVLAIRLESKGKVYYTSKRVGREPFDFYKLRSMRTGADAELQKLAKEKNQYAAASKASEIDFSIQCTECAKLPEGEFCSPILHVGNSKICDTEYTRQKKAIAQSKSAFVKISNDPRVTRVGKFIRNTSIDELPQLINVLKGDMSIVGNRPLPVYEAELLTKDSLSKRFLAPAGITGLWQVELRGKGGIMSEEERKRLDNEYADHFIGDKYSFWYDLGLILRTVPALFQKDSV